MAYMADIRRKNSDSDTYSTPADSLILPCVSDMSLSLSPSLSVASSPSVVEFSPTPAFKDEIPERIMERVNMAVRL